MRSSIGSGRASVIAAFAIPIGCVLAMPGTSHAQTRLPGIVIDTPSPIAAAPPASGAPPITTEIVPAGTTVVIDDSFASVTVVPGPTILSNPGSTITDSLDQRPGIWGSTFAPGASRPIIRGLDTYRVRVQHDGIGTHDVSELSEDHATPIDPNSAEQVEVVRGPATLRYGSQAIGGVVSVKSNRIPMFVPPKGWMGEIKGGLSSVDDGRDGSFSVTAGANGFVVHADGFRRLTENYETPRGTVDNSFVDSHGFGLGLSYVWSKGFLGVSFSRIKSLYGIPGAEEEHHEGEEEHDEEHHTHKPVIDLVQNRVQVKGEWRLKAHGIDAFRMWLGWTDYAHDEVIEEDGERLVGTRFTNKEFEGRFEVQHMPIMTGFGQLRGAAGIHTGRSRKSGVAVDEPIAGLLDPAETVTVAAFVFEELRVSQALRYQAAVRVERTTVDGSGIAFDPVNPEASPDVTKKAGFTPVSGSIGALYELPAGIVLSVTGQYVERAPAAGELFSKGVHEATGTFEIGNSDLDKEKAVTAEIGLRRAKGRFRFDSSVYYARYFGFIYKDLDGRGCGETLASCGTEDDLALVTFQQRDATFYGLEIAASYDVAPIWRGVWGIDGRYDFVRAQFVNGENVPRIPPHRVGAGIYYRDVAWFARLGMIHAFEQDKIGVNEVETPGYTLVSAELSYTTKLEQTRSLSPDPVFTLGIKGTNLTDDVVLNHASFKRREEILLPGASVRVFGSLRWQ
jgi:iron complex outermembrane recepter protein